MVELFRKLINYSVNHEKIYCYGAGKYGKIISSFLKENQITPTGFLVTNNEEDNRYIMDIPVFSIKTSPTIAENVGIIVAVCENKQKEIIKTLEKKGISDYFCVEDELLNIIDQKCNYTGNHFFDNNITVFCYHRIADIPMDTWKLAIKPKLFEEQLKYIKENYEIIRSEDIWVTDAKKKYAVITFDDGYQDAYTNALPILEKYKIPATVFVCTGNINTKNEFWWDELEKVVYSTNFSKYEVNYNREKVVIDNTGGCADTCYRLHPILKKLDYKTRSEIIDYWKNKSNYIINRDYCLSLNEKELKALSKSEYITIGGHTVTHSCLANESIKEQKWEIEESKVTIESIIGKKINVFSYPFGQKDDFTKETIKIAEESGYTKIFAAYEGITNDKYVNGYIPRINIGQIDDYESSVREIRRLELLHGYY